MHIFHEMWFEHDKNNWWAVKNDCPVVWDNHLLTESALIQVLG